MTSPDSNVYDLSQLPNKETDKFEFKSSRVQFPGELEKKIQAAVSAFSNSGGGVFIAGVSDKNGDADGGILSCVGRTSLRDWVDRVIHQVAPPPSYEIKYGVLADGRGTINEDRVVLVVIVKESNNAPHMAPDKKYYIRAGVHTDPAPHFLVEALWAKRHMLKPVIRHVVRPKPDDDEVIQLGVVAVTDAPAIDVEIAISHMPLHGKQLEEFPLHVSLIDRRTPLFFDVSTRETVRESPDRNVFSLEVGYHDLESNTYEYKTTVDLTRSLSSLRFFTKGIDLQPIEDSLRKIADSIAGRPNPFL